MDTFVIFKCYKLVFIINIYKSIIEYLKAKETHILITGCFIYFGC